MAILNLDLAGSLAVHQGYEWRAIVLIGGKAIGSSVVGKVFDRFGGTDLATFRFEPPRYLPEVDKTRFPLFLTASTTSALPLTGSGFYVYNIRLTRPGKQPILLLAGKVKILAAVPL